MEQKDRVERVRELLEGVRADTKAKGVKQRVKDDREQVVTILAEEFENERTDNFHTFPWELWKDAINEAEGLGGGK